LESIDRILTAGIPVMGHLGLTPQSINKFGTYTVRATNPKEAEKTLNDARILEQHGCFAIVLEKIPADFGKLVTETVSIPTIGIGAGMHTNGQVLVFHDMMGYTQQFSPRFLRRYHNLSEEIINAVSHYIDDVKKCNFPSKKEQY
jgi:3-methyl-2-oxobutanoate hydroxymethyltransferase